MSTKESWAVKLTNATAKWEASHSENTLDSINLDVGKGKLYAVIGTVGSGKSSLLSVLLGELPLLETPEPGEVKVLGGLSYAGQEAWVFGATVRQNILFGQAYDRHRYHRVTKACALLSDFDQLPQGDMTIVGDRGSSLSGGQKARINLARAVYRQADVYLLDDPLSAVIFLFYDLKKLFQNFEKVLILIENYRSTLTLVNICSRSVFNATSQVRPGYW